MEDLRRLRSEMQRPANLRPSISDDLFHPHGFADVYGGPPRSIFSHQLLGSSVFYDDIFWPAAAPLTRRGRNLPLFDIPSVKQSSSSDRCSRQKNSFLSHIFSREYSKKMMSSRSRSRSKTNSSSALSSEELSPLRPATSDHVYDDVSLLASKLRPINVHTKWNSEESGSEDRQKQQKLPYFSVKKPNFDSEDEDENLDKLWGCPLQSNQTKEIKECMDLQHMNFRVSQNDDVQFNSPSSAVSSDGNDEASEIIDEMDEDDLNSSYVIEIGSCSGGTPCESNDVDEAIAWAKEKFHQHSSQDNPTAQAILDQMVDESQIPSKVPMDSSQLVVEDEASIVDEKIRLWMIGKESDVRLLLSSLHHILWPNSGWVATPLMKLMESSQVKKAYQKSVLCLHPDKLQQRGATPLQKYIAEKAFAAIQDAWTAFGPLDASSR